MMAAPEMTAPELSRIVPASVPRSDCATVVITEAANKKLIDQYEKRLVQQEDRIDELESALEEARDTAGGTKAAENQALVESLQRKLNEKDMLLKSYQRKFESGGADRDAQLAALRLELSELQSKHEELRAKEAHGDGLKVPQLLGQVRQLEEEQLALRRQVVNLQAEKTDLEYQCHLKSLAETKVS